MPSGYKMAISSILRVCILHTSHAYNKQNWWETSSESRNGNIVVWVSDMATSTLATATMNLVGRGGSKMMCCVHITNLFALPNEKLFEVCYVNIELMPDIWVIISLEKFTLETNYESRLIIYNGVSTRSLRIIWAFRGDKNQFSHTSNAIIIRWGCPRLQRLADSERCVALIEVWGYSSQCKHLYLLLHTQAWSISSNYTTSVLFISYGYQRVSRASISLRWGKRGLLLCVRCTHATYIYLIYVHVRYRITILLYKYENSLGDGGWVSENGNGGSGRQQWKERAEGRRVEQ